VSLRVLLLVICGPMNLAVQALAIPVTAASLPKGMDNFALSMLQTSSQEKTSSSRSQPVEGGTSALLHRQQIQLAHGAPKAAVVAAPRAPLSLQQPASVSLAAKPAKPAKPAAKAVPLLQALPALQALPWAPASLMRSEVVLQAAAVQPVTALTAVAAAVPGPPAPLQPLAAAPAASAAVTSLQDASKIVLVIAAPEALRSSTLPEKAAAPAPILGLPEASHNVLPPEPRVAPLSAASKAFELLQGITFTFAIKALCLAGNVACQVSPFPQVKRWQGRRDTGEADSAPLVAIAFGGWQWCFYGLFAWLVTSRSAFLILFYSNFLGAILGPYYTHAFYKNCRDDSARSSLKSYVVGVAILAFLQVVVIATLPAKRALFFSGLVASSCSFANALSMMVTVPIVMRTACSDSLPGPLLVANLVGAITWVICGVLLGDPWIACPNAFCCLCCGACLYLKFQYNSVKVEKPKQKKLLEPKKCGYEDLDMIQGDFEPASKRGSLGKAGISMMSVLLQLPAEGKSFDEHTMPLVPCCTSEDSIDFSGGTGGTAGLDD